MQLEDMERSAIMDIRTIKEQICDVCHKMWQLGWVAANDGNVSAKLEMCIRDSLKTVHLFVRKRRTVVHRFDGSAAAVSYTHLDVYKRQQSFCPRGYTLSGFT